MARNSRLIRVNATGLVIAGPVRLLSISLHAAAVVATLAVQDTVAGGGTDCLSLACIINDSRQWTAGESVYFGKGIYATIGGAAASASFEIEMA
jgi:hypothetical protein